MKTYLRSLFLAALPVAIAACGGNPEPAPAPPPPAPAPTASRPATPPPTNNNDAARAREAELARMRSTMAEIIFFDYDRSEIRADSRAVLDRKTRIMRDEPTVRIRIEGHADERGSTEYNLALGQRRAQAVKDYFANYGLNADRFEVVSLGEERPLVNASNEQAWAQNRRAEFAVTAGDSSLNP